LNPESLLAAEYLYLTELQGLPVFDVKGRALGRIRDAAVVPLVHPCRVDRYLIGGGWSWMTVRHDFVRSISIEGVWLHTEQLTPYHDDESMLRLVQDLLDQQIIDAEGRKVVRVSDVTFRLASENGHDVLLVDDVDIGLRAVLRRVLQGVVPRSAVRWLQRPIPPKSIAWSDCNIIEPDPRRRLRLDIQPDRLETIHPADLADIVEHLSPEDRGAILESIDSEVAAETLSEIEPRIQARILESLDPEAAAEILDEMAPDEAADILGEIDARTSEEILEEMSPEPKEDVEELLEFDERTAGGLMNTDAIALPETSSVAEAIEAVRESPDIVEAQNALFLAGPGGRLTGVVPTSRLLLAAPHLVLSTLQLPDLITVAVDASREEVTEVIDKYNLLTLPVVDAEGRLLGVVTADDVISLLRRS
jgi:sporulation protein YlmC with PRC-barrel domain